MKKYLILLFILFAASAHAAAPTLDVKGTGGGSGASLSSSTPTALDGTGAVGTGNTAARSDHKHAVTPAGIGAATSNHVHTGVYEPVDASILRAATTLSSFTGSTIPDSSTVQGALQALETALELRALIASPTFTGTATFETIMLGTVTLIDDSGVLTSDKPIATVAADGYRYLDFPDNTARTGVSGHYEMYFEGGIPKCWQSDTESSFVTDTGTQTLTGKTFDASATGNVLKQTKTLLLTHPDYCDETGALINTTKGDTGKFGQCKFSNSADKAGNYAIYEAVVPEDINTAVDLTVRIYFRLGGADTAAHAYKVSMSSVAASAADAGSFSNEVALNFAGDASGADGDLEIYPALASSAATLTDWKGSLTAGQHLLVKLARDGDDATNDASTVDSYTKKVVIFYGSTQ